MAAISDIVSVQITTSTTGVTAQNFGRPMLAAYHTVFGERARLYSSLSGMVADGFATTDPAYKMAQRLLSSTPRVKDFYVGRRAFAATQSFNLVPTKTTEGLVYTVSVTGPGALTGETFTYTCGAAETVAGITAGLVADMAGRTGDWTPTDNTTSLDIDSATAGNVFNVVVDAYMDLKDNTADPGVGVDIAAIDDFRSDWYCLGLDSCSAAEASAAAATIQTLGEKIFVAHTADSDVLDSVATTDMASVFKTASYARSAVFFNRASGTASYAGIGAAGKALTFDPGTLTWNFKTVSGLLADTFTTSERNAALTKSANIYEPIGGVNVIRVGTVGTGEYIDVVRYIDYLTARLRERVANILFNAPGKLPYTDSSVATIVGEVRAQLREGVESGALRDGFTVTFPLVADVSVADRAARNLPDIEFSAQLAGAVHTVEIQGVVSV